MVCVQKHFKVLGYRVKDKVTGYTGVATAVCFDLYGCVQVTVHPGLDKDGKTRESLWFDAARLQIISKARVMPIPDFDYSSGDVHGPAEKPTAMKV